MISFAFSLSNIGKSIFNTIQRVLDQSFQDFEIIQVNDDSQVNTVLVVNSYKNKYLNIRLIKHDVNFKKGTSCNIGLKYTQGEYI